MCRGARTPCHFAVSIGSLHHKHNDKLPAQGTLVWRFLMVRYPPDNVNVSENHEPSDEQVPESLYSCTERSFLSQRQCPLIYQQLRDNDSCLEESFSALMHGSNSDGRLCVLEVCAARDFSLDQYSQTKTT